MSLTRTSRLLASLATILLLGAAPGCGGGAADSGSGPAPDPGSSAGSGASASAGTGSTAALGPAKPVPAGNHHRCGWIGADHFEEGVASFMADPTFFQAIHPKWFTLDGSGTPKPNKFVDDPRVVNTARQNHVQLIPLIDADSASPIRSVMSSPNKIAAHAALLAQLAQTHGYDGIELDYEHLWNASDRTPFVELVRAVAAALHQEGKVLTLAVPTIDRDHGDNAYDYAALSRDADILHMMGYDYHYLGGSHLGPLAPVGWLRDAAQNAASIAPEKFVLGVANYGIGSNFYTLSSSDAQKRCTGPVEETTNHMLSCPYGHQEAGLSPHCQTGQGEEWFEDTASLTEKVAIARQAGLGGIAYWTIGGELPGWKDAIRAAYP